jgi:hypothetical protein
MMNLPLQAYGTNRFNGMGRAISPMVAAQLFRPVNPVRVRSVFAVDGDSCFERARDRYIDCQIDCQTQYSDGTLNQDFCLDACDAGFRVDVWLCKQ